MCFLLELNTSKTFFPHVINEWNKLDPNIHSSSTYNIFCNALLKFIRPVERKIFNINDPFGIQMLTRLKLGFSHMNEHKFRHSFKDTLNPLCCSCGIEAESTTPYFLCCDFYNSNQDTLMNNLESIPFSFSTVSDKNLISLHLHDNHKFDETKNRI